jgi:glycosyltransferase involved in cell wall biosynthesis
MELEPKIVILLSAYNGEDYLAEQLDSLLNQTYSNFIIIIRDDASTDSTEQIINHYEERNQGKIHKLSGTNSNVGPSSSFGLLIKYAIKEKIALGLSRLYMMLCDQDDIWIEEKLEIQMLAMLNAERKSPDAPVIVHSDLKVVDESKEVIAESFVEYQGLEVERNKFTNIVISNLVTGCTTLFNEELAQIALPIPGNAIMHDWWLALTASVFGRVIFIDMPLVEYRQHQNNTIGAKEFTKAQVSSHTWFRFLTLSVSSHLVDVAEQASEFQRRFGKTLGFKHNFFLKIVIMMKFRLGGFQRLFYRIARLF